MTTIADLQRRMDEAAAALDFETASRLRDRISLLRGAGDDADVYAINIAGLIRQQPGSMGLGTGQQRMTPPPGWKPPVKPDSMTKGKRQSRKPR